MKITHWIIAITTLSFNCFYFLEQTFSIVKTGGGGMGFGLLVLQFTLSVNLLIIPAVLTFTEKFNDHNFIFTLNLLGLLWTIFCFMFPFLLNN